MGSRPKRETVGERIRRLRVEQGLSQREIGDAGVTYAYISRIEAGTRRPSVKALRLIAPKLGTTPEYLETGVEPPDLNRALRAVLAARCRAEYGLGDSENDQRLRRDLDRALVALDR